MEQEVKPTEEVKVEEPKVEENQAAPEDIAARDFQMMFPEFKKRLDGLSKKALRKLFTLVTEYPLGDKKVDLSMLSQVEKEVFYLGLHINDAKFVMMRAVLNAKKEELETLIKNDKDGTDNG